MHIPGQVHIEPTSPIRNVDETIDHNGENVQDQAQTAGGDTELTGQVSCPASPLPCGGCPGLQSAEEVNTDTVSGPVQLTLNQAANPRPARTATPPNPNRSAPERYCASPPRPNCPTPSQRSDQ